MSSLRKFFQSEFSMFDTQWCDVEASVMECCNLENNATFESRWRFLMILKHCLNHDYNPLNYKDEYLSPYSRKLIANSKYHSCTKLEILFPLEYIKFIMGSQGKHIQRICIHYNCEIRFDVSRYGVARRLKMFPNAYFTVNTPGKSQSPPCTKVPVLIYHNSPETMADVRDALVHHITCVVRNREKHKRQVCEHLNFCLFSISNTVSNCWTLLIKLASTGILFWTLMICTHRNKEKLYAQVHKQNC